MRFWHDGTLTVGNKGKAKKQDVVAYVKEHSSLGVEKNQIYLGEIDMSDLVYVDSDDMKELIGNLIMYALVRDAFRKEKLTDYL